ncbi:hypothetical protein [Paraburkholderia sp.]|jgi:hypothetical protein|uniref:hypothetical protein n=1 Tax=Paraburkholderia sp. TaxID=1926495 RepID=UPI002AFE95D3|nr:hypothetical protein [Paraburkholderia sp.]
MDHEPASLSGRIRESDGNPAIGAFVTALARAVTMVRLALFRGEITIKNPSHSVKFDESQTSYCKALAMHRLAVPFCSGNNAFARRSSKSQHQHCNGAHRASEWTKGSYEFTPQPGLTHSKKNNAAM